MNNVVNYSLHEAYSSMKSIDKLAKNYSRIDQESLRLIVKKLFRNDTGKGERQTLMKLQRSRHCSFRSCTIYWMNPWRGNHDRISFHNFLHYPEIMHDSGY